CPCGRARRAAGGDGTVMAVRRICTSVDYHTAGEPFRIIADPPAEVPGATVAEKRARAVPGSAGDERRRLLGFEPRGQGAMLGGFITAPDDDGAELGLLCWPKAGLPTAC